MKQENAENYREPLFETTDFTFETTQANDIFYINPQFFFGKIENLFKSDKRIYEIDFGCNQELVMSMEINLPSGYETDQLPKNVLLTAPDSSFSYKRVMSSDANRVIMTQIYEIKRSQFRPDEYRSIQDFFKRLYALMNEEIVVRKKK